MHKEKERTIKILSCPFLILSSKLQGCQNLSLSLLVLNLERDVSKNSMQTSL